MRIREDYHAGRLSQWGSRLPDPVVRQRI